MNLYTSQDGLESHITIQYGLWILTHFAKRAEFQVGCRAPSERVSSAPYTTYLCIWLDVVLAGPSGIVGTTFVPAQVSSRISQARSRSLRAAVARLHRLVCLPSAPSTQLPRTRSCSSASGDKCFAGF